MQKCNRTDLGKSPSKLFFFLSIFFIEVQLNYSVVLIFTVQQCDLVIQVYNILVFYSFPFWFIIGY